LRIGRQQRFIGAGMTSLQNDSRIPHELEL